MLGKYAIVIWFDEPTQLELNIRTDRSEVQRFTVSAERGYTRIGVVNVNDAHMLELQGQITTGDAAPRAFKKRYRCNNMTQWTAPLFSRCSSSMLQLFASQFQLMALKHQLEDEVRVDIQVEPLNETPIDAIAALEKQLGAVLPDQIVDFASHKISINHSTFISADTLRPALEIMESWDGQPHDLLNDEPEVEALYRRSVVLFRQIGDGVGYVLYDAKMSECYWTHQESITQPKRLVFHNGEPMDIARALAFCIAATELYSLDEYIARPQEPDEVTIDDLHPAPSFSLSFNPEPRLEFTGLDPYKSFDALTI
jgi:hypothetical protein